MRAIHIIFSELSSGVLDVEVQIGDEILPDDFLVALDALREVAIEETALASTPEWTVN